MMWLNFSSPFRLIPIYSNASGSSRRDLWIVTLSWLGCELVLMSKSVASEAIDRLNASIKKQLPETP